MKCKLLALDTSTAACSVALYDDGVVEAEYQVIAREHNQHLLTMVAAVLKRRDLSLAQLDALAFGRGPGSFTGLRIAAASVQGLALAAELPVVPVSTLQAMAARAHRELKLAHLLAYLDARMHEIYWGYYQLNTAQQMEAALPDRISALAEINIPSEAQVAVGDIALPELALPQITDFYPHARDIAEIAVMAYARGEAVAPELALPVYLRELQFKKLQK